MSLMVILCPFLQWRGNSSLAPETDIPPLLEWLTAALMLTRIPLGAVGSPHSP